MPPVLAERDLARARRLPDDFLTATGDGMQRLSKVVRYNWPRHPLRRRAGLAEQVLPLLLPLLEGIAVTDDLRMRCAQEVARWLAEDD